MIPSFPEVERIVERVRAELLEEGLAKLEHMEGHALARRRSDHVIHTAELITIGELARITGQRYGTLKYYTEEALLPFTQDDAGLTRRYRRFDYQRDKGKRPVNPD